MDENNRYENNDIFLEHIPKKRLKNISIDKEDEMLYVNKKYPFEGIATALFLLWAAKHNMLEKKINNIVMMMYEEITKFNHLNILDLMHNSIGDILWGYYIAKEYKPFCYDYLEPFYWEYDMSYDISNLYSTLRTHSEIPQTKEEYEKIMAHFDKRYYQYNHGIGDDLTRDELIKIKNDKIDESRKKVYYEGMKLPRDLEKWKSEILIYGLIEVGILEEDVKLDELIGLATNTSNIEVIKTLHYIYAKNYYSLEGIMSTIENIFQTTDINSYYQALFEEFSKLLKIQNSATLTFLTEHEINNDNIKMIMKIADDKLSKKDKQDIIELMEEFNCETDEGNIILYSYLKRSILEKP